ncbi:hypothetical protein KAR91_52985 [Candidatus Pacearchaeota archaeon]|nr:hypothetical protein [Candidatus Pacearchaeota archaeon]
MKTLRKIILTLLALGMIGCASGGYKAQRIEVARHTLVLHDTHIQMENAYSKWWSSKRDKGSMKARGAYTGWFDPTKNDLHCVVPWSERCMIHEYKHLAEKYGLKIPNDPHFSRKESTRKITEFTLSGH